MPSADHVLSKLKKCFLKEKGICLCTISNPTFQRTSRRYLNFPQIFVMKILKGVNEVLLHFHVQRVFHFWELPHGLPHLTKRWAWKREGSSCTLKNKGECICNNRAHYRRKPRDYGLSSEDTWDERQYKTSSREHFIFHLRKFIQCNWLNVPKGVVSLIIKNMQAPCPPL